MSGFEDAFSQESNGDPEALSWLLEEVIVTGSKIYRRDNYNAPTPLSSVSSDEIALAVPTNIADIVNQMPQFAGSATTRTNTFHVGSGAAGSSFLNLRNFGAERTLTLLNGRRVAPTSIRNIVDTNVIPSTLISRVDTVTGGASAVYGSDAVSGIVNFILDTGFDGFQYDIQGGITDKGDNEQGKFELAWGTPFFSGRGHLVLSASHSENQGVKSAKSRSWFQGYKVVPNPDFVEGNGQPQQIIRPNVNFSLASQGGLIVEGPLAGTTFDKNGNPRAFDYGTRAGGVYAFGGEPNDIARNIVLETPLERSNFYAHADFQVTDQVELFSEIIRSQAIADNTSVPSIRLGNITIDRENAYLPESIQEAMDDHGIKTFRMGSTNENLGVIDTLNERDFERYMIGGRARIGSGWVLDGYYQHGKSEVINKVSDIIIVENYLHAVAARNQGGTIVCAINADVDATNDDTDCVPLNIFGEGVASDQAMEYVNGNPYAKTEMLEKVASVSLSGEPFDVYAGPVSIATGIEYRSEEVKGEVDSLSLNDAYFAGNFKPTFGDYDLIEGFIEAAIPLASAIDLNAAFRRTDYSTSGAVNTWKLGLSYEPTPDIRLRVTQSRDIRAPNLNELYLSESFSSNQNVRDPVFAGAEVNGIGFLTSGNLELTPEIADTLTAGVVLSPEFLPGFNMSLDYYDIQIENTITSISGQAIVDRCFAGNQDLCQQVIRDSSTDELIEIHNGFVNLAEEGGSGFDIEISYLKDLSEISMNLEGILRIRALGSYANKHYKEDGIVKDSSRGENTGAGSDADSYGLPRWRWTANIGYERGRIATALTIRSLSSGVYDNDWTSLDIDSNSIAGATYFDAVVAYSFPLSNSDARFFIKIDNLLDRDPELVAGSGSQIFAQYGANSSLYDVLGRSLRAGLNVRF